MRSELGRLRRRPTRADLLEARRTYYAGILFKEIRRLCELLHSAKAENRSAGTGERALRCREEGAPPSRPIAQVCAHLTVYILLYEDAPHRARGFVGRNFTHHR